MSKNLFIKEAILNFLSDGQPHSFAEIKTHVSEHLPADLEPLDRIHVSSAIQKLKSNYCIYRVDNGKYKIGGGSKQINILKELESLINTIDSSISDASFEMDQQEFEFSKWACELKNELLQYRVKLYTIAKTNPDYI